MKNIINTKNKISSANDFDFIIGQWSVKHRRLKERLVNCTDWIEFEGTSTTQKILGGFGNIEDCLLLLPEGEYRAAAIRCFNSATAQWSIWWLDMRNPRCLDVPVVGQFENAIGVFYADDKLDGHPIKVSFIWRSINPNLARWEQAFSNDGGVNWETNWIMDFVRLEE